MDNVLNEYIGPRHGAVNDFLEYFNADLGIYAISRQTLHKWRTGQSRPDPRILSRALEVYGPDDPRHVVAVKLLEVVDNK